MTYAKRSLLAASAAALLSLPSAAAAQGWGGMGDIGNYYLKGFVGASTPLGDDVDFGDPFDANIDANYDTGYLVGAAVGYNYTPNFAVELELAYRNSDFDDFTLDDEEDTFQGDELNSTALMLNGIYTFDGMGATGAWKPYVGAGLGAIMIEGEIGDASGTSPFDNDAQLAYQAMAGVGYELNPMWDLYGEVRYLGTENDKLWSGSNSVDVDYRTIDVLVGASYKF